MKKAFQPILMVVVWVLLMVCGHLILQQTLPEDSWGYRFIYKRGPVQWAILGLTVWAVMIMYARWRRYCQQANRFRGYLQQQSPPPEALAEVLRRASRFWQEAGPKAVRTYLDRLRSEQHESLDKYYDLPRYLIGALPFLGLFGTVVGLTMALEQAFSQGTGNGAVEKFVAGLAVALDTTVLGMVCAAPLFTCLQWLLARHHGLVDRIIQSLRNQFRLEELPDQEELAAVLQEQLGRISKRIAEEAKAFYADLAKQTKSTFAELAAEGMDTLRTALEQGVGQHLAQYQQAQQTAMETFTTHTTELFHEGFQQVAQTLLDRVQEIFQEHRQMVVQQHQLLQEHQRQSHQQQRELLQQYWQAVVERFERAGAQMAEELRTSLQPTLAVLGDAIQATPTQWSQRLEEVVEAVRKALRPMVAELIQQTTQQTQQFHTNLTRRLCEQMGRLEQVLHNRTPEEIVIRYRDGQLISQESNQCPEPILA